MSCTAAVGLISMDPTMSDDDRSSTVTIDSTTETKGIGEYADVNGINLYYEIHGAGRPMILLHGGLGSGEMFGPILADAGGEPPGHRRRPPGPRPHGRHRPAARHPAHGRRHRGAHRPSRARQAGRRRLLARRRRRVLHRVEVPREGRQAGHGRGQHPARRDPGRDARPAGPGERGGGRVHEGHADVRALSARRSAARRTSGGCWTRSARRWPRTSTSARRSGR